MRADAGLLERLAEGGSVLHRLPSQIKLLFTFAYIVFALSRKNPAELVWFFAYPALALPIARVPAGAIGLRVLLALPFSLFGGISNLLFLPHPAGIISFTSIMLKTVISVTAVLLLMATTPFYDLIRETRILPKAFRLQIFLTYRYIVVLINEARCMYLSYKLRSGGKGAAMRDAGVFLGGLLLRSADRAGRIYTAMKLRGGIIP